MTSNQLSALWELCRQGLPLSADEAEKRWARGLTYELDPRIRISRYVEFLIEQCNWEAKRLAEAA